MKYIKAYEYIQEEYKVGDYVEVTNRTYIYLNLPWYEIVEIDNGAINYKYRLKRIDDGQPYNNMWQRIESIKKVPDYLIAAKKYNI